MPTLERIEPPLDTCTARLGTERLMQDNAFPLMPKVLYYSKLKNGVVVTAVQLIEPGYGGTVWSRGVSREGLSHPGITGITGAAGAHEAAKQRVDLSS